MSEEPTSAVRPPQASRLLLPGSMTKRSRPVGGSVDLESGLEAAKRIKMAPPDIQNTTSTLNKARSKSTMNLTDKGSTIRGRVGVSTRPSQSRPTESSASSSSRPLTSRRATAATTNSIRVEKENRMTREKSNVSSRSTIAREKSTVGSRTSASSTGVKLPNGKRPAWDTKGRLEDMENKFSETLKRVEMLENEKKSLQTDNEVTQEVVTKTTQQARNLQNEIDVKTEEITLLKKNITKIEEENLAEVTKLRRQLEDEEFNRSSLQRKFTALEDELSSKQTEVAGLKNSVAELSSSRAGLEASLQTATADLTATKARVDQLTGETESQKEALQKMEEKLNWEETQRRKLHNLVQELKGNIRVFCRVRPLLGEEVTKYGAINHIVVNTENSMELVKNTGTENDSIAGGLNKNMKYDFEFDRVFSQSASQQVVFEEISQLVQSALDGYNVCVFAYGQTGSGKTFTMEGGDVNDLDQAGMIPRTINQIFEVTEKLKEKGWSYTLQASFLEIYNEEIRDLLAIEKNLKYDIKMCDSKGSDVYVTNLKTENVTSESEIASLLRRARKHRAVAETLCNERSSRSHSVFMLKISGTNMNTTESCCGTLNLVDLAGSERVKESGSHGQRLTEAQAINKSLSNLGNVIMALAQKSSHVPYRNSKLTHLLQNSLGGNSKTLMFVNLNPREDSFNETLNSLRFATKVNQCNIGTAVKKVK